MPTGYTGDIYEGKKEVTFNDFIMQCARAFGALITMRDDPFDAPIPAEFKASDYCERQVAAAKAELASVQAMSDEDAETAARGIHQAEVTAWHQRRTDRREVQKRYEAMLDKVLAWTPPSPDHQELKKFMTDQLTQSIDFDCGTSSYDKAPPLRLSGPEWKAKKVADLEHDVEDYTKSQNEENERIANRNRWLKQLRESL